jgi:hypothetical protein
VNESGGEISVETADKVEFVMSFTLLHENIKHNNLDRTVEIFSEFTLLVITSRM